MSITENLKEIRRLIADVESVDFDALGVECANLGEEVFADHEEMNYNAKLKDASNEIYEASEDLKRLDFDEIIGALQEAETILEAIEETT